MKNRISKLLLVAFALFLPLVFTACGGEKPEDPKDPQKPETPTIPDNSVKMKFMSAEYAGDANQMGGECYLFKFFTEGLSVVGEGQNKAFQGSGMLVNVRVCSETTSNFFPQTGSYPIDTSDLPGSVFAGYINDMYGVEIPAGTVLYELVDGKITEYWYVIGGEVYISGVMENATFIMELELDNGSTEYYHFQGAVEYTY